MLRVQLWLPGRRVPPGALMLDPMVVTALERALKDLQYGHLQLVVHDGTLVRIERVERIRLPSDPLGVGQALSTGPAGEPSAITR